MAWEIVSMLLFLVFLIPAALILNSLYYEYRVIKNPKKDIDLLSGFIREKK